MLFYMRECFSRKKDTIPPVRGILYQCAKAFLRPQCFNVQGYTTRYKQGAKGDLIEVKNAGTGFMLIRRSVIRAMQLEYPELHYTTDYDGNSYRQDLIGKDEHRQKLRKNLYSLFDTSHDKENNNEYLSEDYTFCKRWRDMGGKVWLDKSIKLDHIGRKMFKGDISKVF